MANEKVAQRTAENVIKARQEFFKHRAVEPGQLVGDDEATRIRNDIANEIGCELTKTMYLAGNNEKCKIIDAVDEKQIRRIFELLGGIDVDDKYAILDAVDERLMRKILDALEFRQIREIFPPYLNPDMPIDINDDKDEWAKRIGKMLRAGGEGTVIDICELLLDAGKTPKDILQMAGGEQKPRSSDEIVREGGGADNPERMHKTQPGGGPV